MTVAVRCSICGRAFQVPESNIGSKAKCPRCGQLFVLATTTQANASADTDRIVSEPAETAPTKIGRFEIRKRLGAGAFGTVYQAVDPMLKRDVAVKLQRISGRQSEDEIQRMLREPQAAARLRHTNIVPIYEAGRDQDHFYIAAAYIDGVTLAEAIAAKKFPLEESARIVARLAEALDYAHRQGIVHRDVKPANVMLDSSDEPQLMDFGLARFSESSVQLTHAGAVLGTPAFMSPEQAGGRGDVVGPATDQYALGVVLYQMVAGRLPFDGMPQVVIYHICNTPVTPLKQVAPEVPDELSDICGRALQKDPALRYGTCREFAAALHGWIARRTTPAVIAAPPPHDAKNPGGMTSPPTVAAENRTTAYKPPKLAKPSPLNPLRADRRMSLSRKQIVVGSSAVGVVAVGLTLWLLLRGGEGKKVAHESSGSPVANEAAAAPLESAEAPIPSPPVSATPTESARATTSPTATVRPSAAATSTPPPDNPFAGPQIPGNSIVNGQGMTLVLIQAGRFQMGSPPEDANLSLSGDELPRHDVRISKPFYIGRTEVTQKQWLAVMHTTPWSVGVVAGTATELPATGVTYVDAQEFCRQLGEAEKKTYRLPTEAEWEYACRAGTNTRYFFGDDAATLDEYAWFGGGGFLGGSAQIVAQKKPNPWGLFDTCGNVYEWCSDWYGDKYYAASPADDPRGPVTGTRRVLRGGAHSSADAKYCRSADRYFLAPGGVSGDSVGFRVVMEP